MWLVAMVSDFVVTEGTVALGGWKPIKSKVFAECMILWF